MPKSRVSNSLLLITTVPLVLSMLGCALTPDSDLEAFCSMVALLSNPERYDGKIIQTEGVLLIAFESDSIWLSKEHLRAGVVANSIGIVPPYKDQEFYAGMRRLTGTYVLIEGRFHKGNRREIGAPRGAIKEITRVIPLDRELRE